MGTPELGVVLRDAVDDDVAVFYEHQADPEAGAMAAFPSRDASAHAAHWARIIADEDAVTKAIVVDGEVVGNLVSWVSDGGREVGYWIGRKHWGRGIASAALGQFVNTVADRPLRACVAAHNKGSLRVLEKCGFVRTNEPATTVDGGEGLLLELR